jgi:branched-chain amino acid transport system permease protein
MSLKIVLFTIGCRIAGVAGGLYASCYQYLSPEQFDVLQSAAILTMVVLGKIASIAPLRVTIEFAASAPV